MTSRTQDVRATVMTVRQGHLPKLLVLTSTYPRWKDDPEPGFVHELAARLVGRFEVTVICPHAAGADREQILDNVRVVRYGYAPEALESLVNHGGIITNLKLHAWKWLLVPGFFLSQWLTLRRVRRQWRPDVVHAHWLVPQGIVAATDGRIPFVVTSHGADLFAISGKIYTQLRAYVVSRAAAVTVVSRSMRDRLLVDHPHTQVRVIPMGIDFETRFKSDDKQVRSKLRIISVGRLVGKKGIVHLIDAMPKVLERHGEAFLDIVGFGPEHDKLLSRVKELNLYDHVRFVGAVAQADLPQIYRDAAVCVAPFVQDAQGDQEGLGLVVAEAIGCLCPVIVGDVPAVHDLVGSAPTAIVPQADPAAIARAIIDVLDEPAKAQAQIVALRSFLVDRFSWPVVAERYADILEAVAFDGRDS
jgi:glycosyltransferase involved in cell wall biosynthesis